MSTTGIKIENDPIKHAYVIRALEKHISCFELIQLKSDDLSYAAIWHEDRIITLFGDYTFCNSHFLKYYGKYNFYDLNLKLGDHILETKPSDFNDKYDVEKHILMICSKYPIREPNKAFNKTQIRSIAIDDTDYKYELFNEDSTYIGSLNIEKINEEVFVLTSLEIESNNRNLGYGTYLVSSVLNMYNDKTIILYVEANNNSAISVYQNLGFVKYGCLMNFELKS